MNGILPPVINGQSLSIPATQKSSRAELAARKEFLGTLQCILVHIIFFPPFLKKMCGTELVMGAESLLLFSNSDS